MFRAIDDRYETAAMIFAKATSEDLLRSMIVNVSFCSLSLSLTQRLKFGKPIALASL